MNQSQCSTVTDDRLTELLTPSSLQCGNGIQTKVPQIIVFPLGAYTVEMQQFIGGFSQHFRAPLDELQWKNRRREACED